MDQDLYKEIKFTLDGEGIYPAKMGMEIIPLLSSFLKLTTACSSGPVGIAALESNCISMKFLVPLAFSCAILAGTEIAEGVNVQDYSSAARSINNLLQKKSAVLYCFDDNDYEYARFDGKNTLLPEICSDYTPVKATMAIYGELLDVGGGSSINAHIRSDAFPKTLILDVSKDNAKKLAHKLFSLIGVKAEVNMINSVITGGEIIEIIDYDPLPIEVWLKNEALPLMGKAYDGVNVEDFLRELRNGKEDHE